MEGKEKAQIGKLETREVGKEKIREEGRNHREVNRKIIEILVRKESEKRVERIKNSNYNRDYSELVTENLIEYEKEEGKVREWNEWKG